MTTWLSAPVEPHTCTPPGTPPDGWTLVDPDVGTSYGHSLIADAGLAPPACDSLHAGNKTADLLKSAATYFLDTPPPTVADDNGAVTGTAAFFNHSTGFYAGVLLVVAVAIRFAVIAFKAYRGDSAGDMEELLWLLVASAGFFGCGAAAVQMLLAASHGYAPWVIDLASGGDGYGNKMTDMISDVPQTGLMGDIGDILLAGLAWIAAGLQVLILKAVGLLLPLAVGLWPLFAGIEAIESGKPWRNRLTAPILAMSTYIFFVSNIYALAFLSLGSGGDHWDGIILLLMAVLALPMLMKVFSPFGAAPATGASLGGVAVGAAMAGARMR